MMPNSKDLTALLESIQQGVKQINEKLDRMDQDNKEIKKTVDFLKNDMKNYRNKAIKLNKDNKRLNERLNLLEKNMNYLTNKDRAKNVVIYKVPDNEKENKDLLTTAKKIIQSVNTNIPTESVIEAK